MIKEVCVVLGKLYWVIIQPFDAHGSYLGGIVLAKVHIIFPDVMIFLLAVSFGNELVTLPPVHALPSDKLRVDGDQVITIGFHFYRLG